MEDYLGYDRQSVMKMLSEPVALVRLSGGDAIFEEATQSFAADLGLGRDELAGNYVGEAFGTEAAIQFRNGLLAAVDGQVSSLRIPIVINGQESSRIFLFRADPGSAGSAIVALERRKRDLPEDADDAGNLVPLNSSLFFIRDLQTGDTRFMNRPMAERLDLTGPYLKWMLRRVHDEDRHAAWVWASAIADLMDDRILALTVRLSVPGDRLRTLQIRVGVFARDAVGHVSEVIGSIEDVTDHEALDGALDVASRVIQTIEARERRRVARELHDSTAQHLVAIDLGLSSLVRRAQLADAGTEMVGQIRKALAAAHEEIRTFSYMLHPPQLARDGLEAALANFLDGFGSRTGLMVELAMTGLIKRIPPDVERVLFRVAQEALMNVHRHAGAEKVKVRLGVHGDDVSLEIQDDGVGMTQNVREGVGVSGMKARMAEIGGKLVIQAAQPGLIIRATCPLAESDMPWKDEDHLTTA